MTGITLYRLLRYLHESGEMEIRGSNVPSITDHGLDLIREHARQSGMPIDNKTDLELMRFVRDTVAYQILIDSDPGEADHAALGPDYAGDIKAALRRH